MNFVEQFNQVEYKLKYKIKLADVLDGKLEKEPFIKRKCWSDRFPQGIATAKNVFDYKVLRCLLVDRGGYTMQSRTQNSFGYWVETYENLKHQGLEQLTIITR